MMSYIYSIFGHFTKWWHKVAFFSKATIFISGLVAVNGLIEYALLATLITSLTTDWTAATLPTAAITVNVYEGLTSLLVIVVAQLSESCFGNFKVILFTNVAFILGLGMLWSAVKYQNVIVLFVALVPITIGKAGRDDTMKAFLADQLCKVSSREDKEPNLRRDEELPQTGGKIMMQQKHHGRKEDEDVIEIRRKFYWRVSWIVGIIPATVWLSNEDWLTIVKISTIAMIGGFCVFLCGIPFYVRRKPSPSPLRYIFQVVKVALSKRHLDYPVSPSQLFKNYTSDTEILPHIAFLRWLDKAAILEASPPCPVSTTTREQLAETAGGRVCEVAKVKDVKRLISMFPLWSTFYVSSLVGATADTFFYEQADIMTSSVPLPVFVIIMTFTSSITSIICSWLKNRTKNVRRPPLYRIRLGMLCSVLCCVAAWLVEVRRRNHRKKQKHEISVFWLTPQFFLVGLMQGLSESGLQDFFETQVCESMKGYGSQFNEFARGIGKLFTAVCILIFIFWFGKEVDSSDLDKYYAMLLIPTILNFCFCYLVSKWYANLPHDQKLEDVTNENSSSDTDVTNENSSSDTAQKLEDV
ncbi:hypothetical protein HAX54_035636 [Datura stramonium]|uniref:Uncharacterized protein n=1 Tax=Datura stramonium TaxID=4076 RepID=A0ABS8SFQ8_DATST|nr:hypothetical protein [Datura stramonium]